MPKTTGGPRPCPTCSDIGWVEDIHPSGTMARIIPCPAQCAQSAVMRYSLPTTDTGWYLHGPVSGLRDKALEAEAAG